MSRKQKWIVIVGCILVIGWILLYPAGDAPGEDNRQQAPVHIPQISLRRNVWLEEISDDYVTFFADGERHSLALAEDLRALLKAGEGGQSLADLEITDGAVSGIDRKEEKISGKVLAVCPEYVELDGIGKLRFEKDCKGYQIFHTLKSCLAEEIPVGYAFTDFILEEDKVCGFLIAREQRMDTIRVLLKTDDYDALYHESITITAREPFAVRYEGKGEASGREYPADEELLLTPKELSGRRAYITTKTLTGKLYLKGLARGCEDMGYAGSLEVFALPEGLAVINELPLEEYLYLVVPSEMPASYPMEALKAQAICARTYAYQKMQKAGYPQYGAHLDDSTSFQVYHNTQEREQTTTAVRETYGQFLLSAQGDTADTYYYSTSCGVGSDCHVWRIEDDIAPAYLRAKCIGEQQDEALLESLRENERFYQYITQIGEKDFERGEAWYRWTYQVKKLDAGKVCERLKERYAANSGQVLTRQGEQWVSADIQDFHKISDMTVERRGAGGIADVLQIETDAGTYQVWTEYNIRYLLCDRVSPVVCQNQQETIPKRLLPSAFFAIDLVKQKGNVVGYTIWGGGYGHGVGMSQNAARAMAERGYDAASILQFFFEGCQIAQGAG